MGLQSMGSLRVRHDCPQESVSSSGTPHKRDSFIYSTWLEDSISTTSGGSSPGTSRASPTMGTPTPVMGGGQGWARKWGPGQCELQLKMNTGRVGTNWCRQVGKTIWQFLIKLNTSYI